MFSDHKYSDHADRQTFSDYLFAILVLIERLQVVRLKIGTSDKSAIEPNREILVLIFGFISFGQPPSRLPAKRLCS